LIRRDGDSNRGRNYARAGRLRLLQDATSDFGERDSSDKQVARWTFDSADGIILASGRSGGAEVVTIARKSLVEERNIVWKNPAWVSNPDYSSPTLTRSVSDEASRGGAEAAEEQQRKGTLRDLRVSA
jgi:hypothetical protein